MLQRIDLKLRLMLCMTLLSAICFAASGGYVLVEAAQRADAHAAWTAKIAAKDLEFQLQQMTWVAGPSTETPDLQTVAPLLAEPGLCIAYREARSIRQRFCLGAERAESQPPALFEALYRSMLHPDREAVRSVALHGRQIGTVVVQMDAQTLIEQGWRETSRVLGILAVTLTTLCALLSIAFSRVLKPTRLICAGLQRLDADDLAARLPPFDLGELSAISTVFNQLADNLATARADRDALLRRLLTVQDDERRDLARDLHDELGQCLAAIGAMVASIRQTAAQDCPELLGECDSVGSIVAHMMQVLRGVLTRLRPPDLDEFGLSESLRNLVAGWNANGATQFSIELTGELDSLPSSICTALYRVAQEAITNAVKHARATMVSLCLAARDDAHVALSVEDDGIAGDHDLARSGLGLLGMHERVAALGGVLRLQPRQPTGLVVSVIVPVAERTDRARILADVA